ncbi:hypothetical protein K9F62_00005 [Desulfovibrio sp. JY]|nr:hypothetical protein K9F62_00005 [Desulfovibrio sp. JY]
MTGIHDKANALKHTFVSEGRVFIVLFIYLALLLGGFAWYKRLVLLQYKFQFLHYGYSIVEAAVLAKLILVGNAFGLTKPFRKLPLIWTSLFQTLAISFLAIFFSLEEETVIGLFHGQGLAWGFHAIMRHSWRQILADFIIIFMSLVPLFSIWELGKVLGPRQCYDMFFKRRPPSGFCLMPQAPSASAASRDQKH